MLPSRSLLRVVILGAVALVTPVVFLSGAGTAAADPAPSPSPSCLTALCLPSSSPTPDHTASPTAAPTTAAPTHSASAVATRTAAARRHSPRPRSTYSVSPGSTGNPVTETIGVGAIRGSLATATPSVAPVADVRKKSGDTLGRLVKLVLGGAVLLLLGGLTGLYLTRHPHAH